MVPLPIGHTHISALLARGILEAAEAGVFTFIGTGHKTLEEIAEGCSLHPGALRALLMALTSARYLKVKGNTFHLSASARKWLLPDSKHSILDYIRFTRTIWSWLDSLPQFLRSGQGIEHHGSLSPQEWELYEKSMYGIARISMNEVGRTTPLPRNPRRMLDIGGAHGLYSIALCRRYPDLTSVVLDLPEGIEHAAPLLAREGMGERVRHKAGNALTEDLGENEYDFILISSLMHHFTAEQNIDLTQRIGRALKPGGILAIQEFIRPEFSNRADQIGATLDLFFALSSTSGTWTQNEIKQWQNQAGLRQHKTRKFLTMPGFVQITAKK